MPEKKITREEIRRHLDLFAKEEAPGYKDRNERWLEEIIRGATARDWFRKNHLEIIHLLMAELDELSKPVPESKETDASSIRFSLLELD